MWCVSVCADAPHHMHYYTIILFKRHELRMLYVKHAKFVDCCRIYFRRIYYINTLKNLLCGATTKS